MVVANTYEGQVPIRLGSREIKLQIDYRAVGALISHLGDTDWAAETSKAFNDYDMERVARIIEIAAKRHHPEITVDQILDASPPFQVAYKAVEACIFLFLYGTPQALDNLDLGEGEASEERPLEKNGKIRWRNRGGSRLRQVFGLLNFGQPRHTSSASS